MAAMTSRTFAAVVAGVALSAAGCNLTNSPNAIESTAPPSAQVVQDLVGPGCDAYVRDHASGPGSAEAIAKQSAVAAIASHPELTRFGNALTGKLNARVDLSSELSSGRFTIFAPADSAFEKLPKAAVRTLAQPDSAAALIDLLRSHVVKGERTPAELSGKLETLDGDPITVAAQGDRIRVDGQANVICGGLHTANATLYLIDSVLMPSNSGPSPAPTSSTSDQE
jgi:uncharacterized surface protein with fasciclin (FAS1) repeats